MYLRSSAGCTEESGKMVYLYRSLAALRSFESRNDSFLRMMTDFRKKATQLYQMGSEYKLYQVWDEGFPSWIMWNILPIFFSAAVFGAEAWEGIMAWLPNQWQGRCGVVMRISLALRWVESFSTRFYWVSRRAVSQKSWGIGAPTDLNLVIGVIHLSNELKSYRVDLTHDITEDEIRSPKYSATHIFASFAFGRNGNIVPWPRGQLGSWGVGCCPTTHGFQRLFQLGKFRLRPRNTERATWCKYTYC